jgi:hypothetical protein
MPRARNIKPGIMANDELAELPPETRLLFIYLWMLADREGRMEDRPKRIKGESFPYDVYDVDVMLDQLQKAGFLLRYEVDGQRLIEISGFKKHQHPHIKESDSHLPGPGHEPDKHGASTGQAPDKHQTSTSGARLIPDTGSLIPDTGLRGAPPPIPIKGGEYTVTNGTLQRYIDNYPHIDVPKELAKIAEWNRVNARRRKTKSGIPRHITSWLAKEEDRAKSKRGKRQSAVERAEAAEDRL